MAHLEARKKRLMELRTQQQRLPDHSRYPLRDVATGDGLGDIMTLADDYLSPAAFLVILAAFAVGAAVEYLVNRAHRRAVRRQAARRAKRGWPPFAADPALDAIHPHCRTWGHKYRPHGLVWLCGVCGDRIPRDTLDQEPA